MYGIRKKKNKIKLSNKIPYHLVAKRCELEIVDTRDAVVQTTMRTRLRSLPRSWEIERAIIIATRAMRSR